MQRSRRNSLLLAALAVITPIGLLVVNAAAYIMVHLAEFRLAITFCAVVSTLVLNGLTAWLAYRIGAERWPDFWPVERRHRRIVLPILLLVLCAIAALAGWLTYRGLSDPRRLPNLQSFLAGVIGLAVPIFLGLSFGRSPRARRRTRDAAIRALHLDEGDGGRSRLRSEFRTRR